MGKAKARRDRARALREEIEEAKRGGPRAARSPREFVERRMRELDERRRGKSGSSAEEHPSEDAN